MEKIWLKQYPASIPPEINPDAYASLADLFRKSVAKYRGLPAFTNLGATVSFTELDRLTRDFAAYLQNDLGMKKGDRIAIQMPNLIQYPVALFGALRAGLIVVNTNPLYTPREMEYQFKDAGATTLVIFAGAAHNFEKIAERTGIKNVIVTEVGDLLGFPKKQIVNFAVKYIRKMVPTYSLPRAVTFLEALAQGSKQPLKEAELTGEDIAFLQYTGGTTGVSKAAMLTHRNMVANMEQIAKWITGGLKEREETLLTPLPLYHIFSLTANCLTGILIGARNVLITNPRDIPAFIKDIRDNNPTLITALNTLFNALMNNPEFEKLDFSKLKVVLGGGMAVQRAVAERWEKITGVALLEGYGLTEASPVLAVNPIVGGHRIGSIGLPVPSTDLRVVKEDGQDAKSGEPGELWARGPQVMKGYWNRADETAKVMEGEWLKTGDIATMSPDGFFQIVDRKKDMILVSGFNVYPNEVEDIVARHPGVLEVAALGVPDERSGEVVKVFVVLRDAKLTAEELTAYCRENLTGYKVPKFIEFRKELPKTNVGKILRRALRDEALASAAPSAPSSAPAETTGEIVMPPKKTGSGQA